MHKIILSLILLFFVVKLFSQAQSGALLSKDLRLQKSKNQKTVAWVLLGSGLAIAAAGGIVQLIHDKQHNDFLDLDFTGAYIAIAGGVVGLSSIPFFISSAKNKRWAFSVAISVKKTYLPQQNGYALNTQPTLTFKLEQ